MEKHLELKIERIVPNGFGIGFAENLTVFVPLVAAGDVVKVRVDKQKGKVAFANLIEILDASPDRIAPPCPYFGRCGGCDFQQLNYPAQLRAKVEIIRDCLRRIGKIEWQKEIEIVPSPSQWNYRTRVQWKIEAGKIGYFERNSHRVIDVEVCPILAPALQKELNSQRENLQKNNVGEIQAVSSGAETSIHSGKQRNDFDDNFYAARQLESEQKHQTQDFSANLQANFVCLQVGEFEYNFSADTFFQINHEILPQVLMTAIDQDATGEFAIDLYCGVGLFSLPLAQKFNRVCGVEGNQTSIEFARRNARKANLSNVEFETAFAGDWLNNFDKTTPDFVLLDPPRTGAERGAIESLTQIAPTRIVYVSCNPATLARDLKMLVDSGRFQIEKITAFDFFPQTHHVETIVDLRKN